MRRCLPSSAKALVLCALVAAAALLAVGLWKTILVLEVSSPAVLASVRECDVFLLTYTHSMYHVPVTEKFWIEDGHFRLVHVMTQSDAVLAYLGLESKTKPNVDLKFTEFTIQAGSMGNHVLQFHNRRIPLATGQDRDGGIRVRLNRVPLLVYIAQLIRR